MTTELSQGNAPAPKRLDQVRDRLRTKRNIEVKSCLLPQHRHLTSTLQKIYRRFARVSVSLGLQTDKPFANLSVQAAKSGANTLP
ncbi:hypothetical protein [Methylogaea oryzae]|uniref:hypothetical protein n=1 Tax=Methylogaea oryzae TaxID=1295382 RepID=UPI001C3F40F0|nr:hypothetical protein [Methylogaea oryzae]